MTFLAFCEAVLRESEQAAEILDGLYRPGLAAGRRTAASAASPVPAKNAKADRIAQIQLATRLFGG